MRTNKRVIFTMLSILASYSLFAQVRLELTVKNLKTPKGSLRTAVFATETDFLKKATASRIVKANDSEMTVTFENLKPGDYAISVIHDENDNGELDANMVGIPKEGFGFGNDAMGTFGPPSFEKAKVTLTQNEKHIINLKHF